MVFAAGEGDLAFTTRRGCRVVVRRTDTIRGVHEDITLSVPAGARDRSVEPGSQRLWPAAQVDDSAQNR